MVYPIHHSSPSRVSPETMEDEQAGASTSKLAYESPAIELLGGWQLITEAIINPSAGG